MKYDLNNFKNSNITKYKTLSSGFCFHTPKGVVFQTYYCCDGNLRNIQGTIVASIVESR